MTQRGILIILRMFFRFLLKNDYILKDPTTKIELPREVKSLPRTILTEKEIIKLLEVPDIRRPIGLRNKCILEVLYSTGIRPSELTSIKIHDIDFSNQTLLIPMGKGQKSRFVPLGQFCCYYLELYLKNGRKHFLKGKTKDEGYLFLTTRGNPYDRSSINKCYDKNY